MSRANRPIDREIGRRVCTMRLTLGYNQSQLGRALGVTFQQIQKYEKGANRISAGTLIDIADFFGCDVAEFLPKKDDVPGGEGPTPMTATRHGSELARIFEGLDDGSQKFLLTMARGVGSLGQAAA